MACRQAITWTVADIYSVGHLEMNFSEILIKLQQFFLFRENAFENVVWK